MQKGLKNRTKEIVKYTISLFEISIFPVTFLYCANIKEMKFGEAVPALLAYILLGGLVWIIFQMIFKCFALSLAFTFVGIIIISNFCLLEKVVSKISTQIRYWHLVIVLIVIIGHLAFFASKIISKEIEIYVVNTLFVLITTLTFISDYKSIAGLKLQTEKLSIPLQYDIDDFIFDYKQICYLPFLHQEEYWDFESYCNNIQKTMALCNSYTVSTETLKTAVLALPLFSGKNVTVRRNMASMEMFCLSDLAYANKEMLKNDASQIWLGYFSGSKTHDGDFDVISDVILQLMEQYSNLYLKIEGCLKLPDAFKKYQERIFNFPFKDWRELPREIASVDINLMPLEPTFFNQCKSENKWMEAGLVRVPTVASYNDELALVINGKNGLLCNSMQEWYDNLSYLIEEPKARKAIGEEAYLRIMTSYTTLSLNNRKGCVN